MGYVVVRKKDGRFFKEEITIRGKKKAEWRHHTKLARIYTKRGWAEKAAVRLDGSVVEVVN